MASLCGCQDDELMPLIVKGKGFIRFSGVNGQTVKGVLILQIKFWRI